MNRSRMQGQATDAPGIGRIVALVAVQHPVGLVPVDKNRLPQHPGPPPQALGEMKPPVEARPAGQRSQTVEKHEIEPASAGAHQARQKVR
jgi:hypothetical protein